MSSISVEGLTKRYGDVTALDDASFEIADGEFVVVLGQSGAGKSTLLRVLNGLTTPTEGRVLVDGTPIGRSRADVGMIFQQHNLVEEMSAFGNALTGALSRTSFLRSLANLHGDAEKLEALRALETVGLLAEAEQQVGSMSGGQQQRVGIARALVQQPAVVLADEPVASLDPASAETVMRYLRRAATEHELTTLASLHQVNIARQFGERFIGLRDGDVVFDGDRDELTTAVIDDIYGTVETDAIRDGHDDRATTTDATQRSGGSATGEVDAEGGRDGVEVST